MKKLLSVFSAIGIVASTAPNVITFDSSESILKLKKTSLTYNSQDKQEVSSETYLSSERFNYKLNNSGKNEVLFHETSATGRPNLLYKTYVIKTNITNDKWIKSVSVSNNFEANNNKNEVVWGGDTYRPTSSFAKTNYLKDISPNYGFPGMPEEWITQSLVTLSSYSWTSGAAVLDYKEYSGIMQLDDPHSDRISFLWIVGSWINPKWSFSNGKSWTNLGNEVVLDINYW